jgi:hypothetical protein
LDAGETADAEEDAATPSTTWLSVEETTRALRRDMYAAQRKALVEARNAGELDRSRRGPGTDRRRRG